MVWCTPILIKVEPILTIQRDLLQLEAHRRDLRGPLAVGGAAVDVLTVQASEGVALLAVVASYGAELVLEQIE